jgi:hypothetical protein
VSVPSDRILSALSATESILTQSINPGTSVMRTYRKERFLARRKIRV